MSSSAVESGKNLFVWHLAQPGWMPGDITSAESRKRSKLTTRPVKKPGNEDSARRSSGG
jgi:hypothetical protein